MNRIIDVSRRIPATTERVFDAWLDPKALATFLLPAPGVRTIDVEVDPTVGGTFRLTMLAGEHTIPIQGTYLELDRPRRLVFSWISSRTRADSVVELTFTADGDDTLLRLVHTGFPDAESHQDHTHGWTHILDQLTF